jgi:O-antigen/teichoic acid export membrane protein
MTSAEGSSGGARRRIQDIDPRTRSVVRGVSASVVSRAIGALGPILLVPITLGYLGDETYGFWMAVTAVTGMVVWADLGLGNGVLTTMSKDVALGDVTAARRNLASAYAALLVVAAVLLTALVLLAGAIPWETLFNADESRLAASPEALALVCFGAFIVNIPLSLVQRAQYATDRVAQSNLVHSVGILTSLAVTWTLVRVDAGPVAVVAGAVSGPVLGSLFNSVWFYAGPGRPYLPRPADAHRATSAALMGMGSRFLLLSVVTSAALNVDNLIVTHTLGLEAVADYSVAVRVFTALGLLINLVNLPLWPANAAALARGEHAWVRRMTQRMTVLSAAAVVLPGIGLTLLGPDLVMPLLGSDADVSRLLFVALTVWWTLLGATSPRFMVQNARAILAPQTVGWLAYLVLSVPLKTLAASRIGLEAVPFTGAVLYAACVVTGAVVGYRRAFRDESSGTSPEMIPT